MSEWEYNKPKNPVVFDFEGDFDEQVRRLRSVNGGHIRIGSHLYFVLKALFEGDVIDDYGKKPVDFIGAPINNVRNRVSDLRNKWNIRIGQRQADGKKFVEYKLYTGEENGQ